MKLRKRVAFAAFFRWVYCSHVLEAYRTITVPVNLIDKQVDIEVPFTVEVLTRVEETIHRTEGRTWFRLKKSEKSVIEAFNWFAKPYLQDVDLTKVQPNFTALFFSRVRDELATSINECDKLIFSTSESTEPTAEKTTAEEQPSE